MKAEDIWIRNYWALLDQQFISQETFVIKNKSVLHNKLWIAIQKQQHMFNIKVQRTKYTWLTLRTVTQADSSWAGTQTLFVAHRFPRYTDLSRHWRTKEAPRGKGRRQGTSTSTNHPLSVLARNKQEEQQEKPTRRYVSLCLFLFLWSLVTSPAGHGVSAQRWFKRFALLGIEAAWLLLRSCVKNWVWLW